MDKYGYIGIETLLNFCENSKDHSVTPNDFMRMKRVRMPEQKKKKWIPVSERLPEEEYVIISKKPTKLSGSKWCVTIAIRTADPRSGKIHWRDIGFGVIPDDDVLAWMPLPERYREEGE